MKSKRKKSVKKPDAESVIPYEITDPEIAWALPLRQLAPENWRLTREMLCALDLSMELAEARDRKKKSLNRTKPPLD